MDLKFGTKIQPRRRKGTEKNHALRGPQSDPHRPEQEVLGKLRLFPLNPDSKIGRVAATEFRPAFQGRRRIRCQWRVAERRLNSAVASATDSPSDISIRALKGPAKLIRPLRGHCPES